MADKEYLNYRQTKQGDFSWLDLCKGSGGMRAKDVKDLKLTDRDRTEFALNNMKNSRGNINLPELSMDIEMFCINEFGDSVCYPIDYYDYKLFRFRWVPPLTSKWPFWDYSKQLPSWAKDKRPDIWSTSRRKGYQMNHSHEGRGKNEQKAMGFVEFISFC